MKSIKFYIISCLLVSCTITPNFERYSMIDPNNFSKLNKNKPHILINLDTFTSTVLLKRA